MEKSPACLVLLFAMFSSGAGAQLLVSGSSSPSLEEPAAQASSDALTVFRHPDSAPWYIAGQSNIIFQAHPPFHSPYEGPNSFLSRGEYKTSLLGTLYLADQPFRGLGGAETQRRDRYNTDVIVDFESAAGRGLSEALGLAGFTNLDVVRNPNLGPVPYVSRVELHQTIGFTDELTEATRSPLTLATKVPVRRLEIRAGKMSLPDVFDINSVLSDSHLQFMDWTVDNNGAWDYAADTRGYTYAITLDYQDRNWGVRYGLALMPTVANGINLDWDLRRAHSQNFEGEWRHGVIPEHRGVQRILVFRNNGHMGNYKEAIDAFLSGEDSTPDIRKHEHFDTTKYGFGYNLEQSVTAHLRAAGRFGWNDGKEESFAYTEVEQEVLLGGDYEGTQWHRPNDRIGVAWSSNAIKRDHQRYLALGGLGFLLGDGQLNYRREQIVEAYYNLHVWRGMYFALGATHIANPGYNHDRGPVWVASVRSHIDF